MLLQSSYTQFQTSFPPFQPFLLPLWYIISDRWKKVEQRGSIANNTHTWVVVVELLVSRKGFLKLHSANVMFNFCVYGEEYRTFSDLQKALLLDFQGKKAREKFLDEISQLFGTLEFWHQCASMENFSFRLHFLKEILITIKFSL